MLTDIEREQAKQLLCEDFPRVEYTLSALA